MKITKQLIKQAEAVYGLEEEIRSLKISLEPLKRKLKAKIPYGVFQLGSIQVVKTHIEESVIPKYIKQEYDQLTVTKIKDED